MQRSKLVAVAFYLGAVLVGGVVGVGVDRMTRERPTGERMEPNKARQTFAQRLSLTPEQQAAADSIFGALRLQDSLLWAPFRAQARTIRPQADSLARTARDEFRTRLTPDQQRAYDEMNAHRQRDGRR
jgi:hypothetical protein